MANPKLIITEFGNPILRQKTSFIAKKDITNKETQKLIKAMQELLLSKKLGVGLATPQIGSGFALAIIAIRPSKRRPYVVNPIDLVIINPIIIQSYGYRKQLYDGCISGGQGRAGLFALVPRYKKIRVEYYDENGMQKSEVFEGLSAQVIQHEVDHLNGILFVDRVTDTKSYMTLKEYKKYTAAKLHKTQRKLKD